MVSSIPLGLIGLGRHGSRYLRHLLDEDTGGQLVAISRQQVNEGRQQAAAHSLQFYPDYRNLIADPAIHAVLIVVPPSLHLPMALEAIKQKKPLLIEKPLALNVSQGCQIVEAANQAGVPLMTGHTLRYEPVIRKVQEMAAHLGPWQFLHGTMQLEDRPNSNSNQKTGLEDLLEFGIHLLDWARVMLPKEPLTLSVSRAPITSQTPKKSMDVTLSTSSGVSCRLNFARMNTKRITCIEGIGPKGRIRGDWTSGQIQITNGLKGTAQDILPPTPTIIPMLKDFIQALRTNNPVPISGADGLRAVELAEACCQAALTGQAIPVKGQDFSF